MVGSTGPSVRLLSGFPQPNGFAVWELPSDVIPWDSPSHWLLCGSGPQAGNEVVAQKILSPIFPKVKNPLWEMPGTIAF